MAQEAALQEALTGLLHHRALGSILGFIEIRVTLLELVPIVLQTLEKRGALRMARPVAAEGHQLPETLAGPKLRGQFGLDGVRSPAKNLPELEASDCRFLAQERVAPSI